MEGGKLSQMFEAAALVESPTNPKGDRFKGREFDEMVASVGQLGVLQPIIVRKVKGKFEIVAGHRRVAAAKAAGLFAVPGIEMTLSDAEAKEVQIVENLQRQDVHPLDEAEGYRYMVADLGQRVEEVAKHVGKSERYVRERLGLTNLSPAAAKAYRAFKISTGAAILISKVEGATMQMRALREAEHCSEERLRNFISDMMYADLGGRPWANDAKVSEMLGERPEESLFGKKATDDPVEYGRKMAAYIEHMVRTSKVRMVRISTSYGSPKMKGVLAKDLYKILPTARDRKDASECIKGIVAEGYNDIGKVHDISTAKADLRHSTAHKPTKAEMEKRKKEREADLAAAKRVDDAIGKSLAKVKFPLSKGQLDTLLDIMLENTGGTQQQRMVKRLGLKPVVEKNDGYEHKNHSAALRAHAIAGGESGKLRMVFDLATASPYNQNHQRDALKKL